MASVTGAAEDLLERRPPDESRRLGPRELVVETLVAVAFAAVAMAFVVALPGAGRSDVLTMVLLTAAYALACRVKFQLGPGFLRPTEVVFVPMLFLLAAPAVPLLVAAGAALSVLPDIVRRGAHPERLLVAVADSAYAVAPALVVALAGPVELTWSAWPVYVLVLLSQLSGDLLVSTLREWLGAGVPPVAQVKVIGLVYLGDVLLAPIGLLAAFAATGHAYAYLLAVPSGALLALVARERASRIERALALGRAYRATALLLESQAEDLRRQAARLERSHRRVGEAVASTLDRTSLERVLVTTVLDALDAGVARVTAPTAAGGLAERRRAGDAGWCPAALLGAEAAVLDGGAPQQRSAAGVTALAIPLGRPEGADGRPDVLAVARSGASFSAAERELFADLAAQATVSLNTLTAHEAIRRQASIDELTGLLNRRRLEEALSQEIGEAERTGRPVALVLLDIDNFKQINDTHGHQQGDRVLAEVGRVTRAVARHGDHAARYGGEELAVVLPGAGVREASRVAERLRRAVAELALPLPGGGVLELTASLGVASVPETAHDRDSLVAAADAGLYVAKRTGKNRVGQGPPQIAAATDPVRSGPSRRFSAGDTDAAVERPPSGSATR